MTNLSDLISRLSQRIDRFVVHRQINLRIRQMAEQVSIHAQPLSGAQPVIFFNASTRLSGLSQNAAYNLLTSWAVRLAGAPIIHFVCESGLSRCVLGTQRDDPHTLPPCRECIAQSRAITTAAPTRWFKHHADPSLAQALASMSVLEMETFEVEDIPLGELVLPSLRWVLRRHHLLDDENTRFLFREYLLSAWWVVQEFNVLLDETQPQAIVVFNGMFYPEAAARYTAGQRGITVISHEVGLQPLTGYFTNGEATAYPIDIPTEFELNPEQNARLDAYLEQRMQGNFSMAGIRFWASMQPLSAEFLEKAAGFTQIVPVFTNVIFDTSQAHANVIFEHMFAWLDEVLGLIKDHPETLFVIRAHPDEFRPGKAAQESVADWVLTNQVETLPNVIFVNSGEHFSSYELIQRSKFVMVYNSTIGLEAALMGAAVLCAGKARFTQLPTVFFPQSAAEFHRQAVEFLSAQQISVPAEFRRNARRFLYYQLYRTSLPFDALLQADGIWKGYVDLKSANWRSYSVQNSETLRIIVEGIIQGKPFLMD